MVVLLVRKGRSICGIAEKLLAASLPLDDTLQKEPLEK
jgi:hypothetical protein